MQKDFDGSFTIEAALTVPVLMLFIAAILIIDIRLYKLIDAYIESTGGCSFDYPSVHRAASAIFDAGTGIYEKLFG